VTNSTDSEELGEKCDFDRCHCVPDGGAAFVDEADNKTVYCSVGCQQGRGCNCETCNCANAG